MYRIRMQYLFQNKNASARHYLDTIIRSCLDLLRILKTRLQEKKSKAKQRYQKERDARERKEEEDLDDRIGREHIVSCEENEREGMERNG